MKENTVFPRPYQDPPSFSTLTGIIASLYGEIVCIRKNKYKGKVVPSQQCCPREVIYGIPGRCLWLSLFQSLWTHQLLHYFVWPARSKSQMDLLALTSDFTFTFHFHALEKEMATHSSVLAWRIPGMGEPDGLPSVGLHRVGHDWSDLAAAAALLPGCEYNPSATYNTCNSGWYIADISYNRCNSGYISCLGLPRQCSGQESACQCRRSRFNPWVRKICLSRKWQPTPVFLPGKSHRQRSLVGYSPRGHKESDTTERARRTHTVAWRGWPQLIRSLHSPEIISSDNFLTILCYDSNKIRPPYLFLIPACTHSKTKSSSLSQERASAIKFF